MTVAGADILLLGGTGQVGSELLPVLQQRDRVLAPTRAELDLTNLAAVREWIERCRPRMIVNAAALTAVDRAEAEPVLAFALNEHLPRVLAEECARLDALLVHYSTDYVFGGESSVPYRENDPAAPVNVYGMSKLAGESAIADVGGRHLIFRTSWVYGSRANNFVSNILRLIREKGELKVVIDQRSRPTWSRRLAEATGAVLEALRAGNGWRTPSSLSGTYHLAGGGEASRYEFANAVADERRRAGLPVLAGIRAVTSDEFAAPAQRPRYSVLDTRRIGEAFNVSLPDWREDLPVVMRASAAW